VGASQGAVGVLLEVGGQGEEGGKWRFLGFVLGHHVDHMVAEELVRVCEVVCGHQDTGFLGGSEYV
jgi:hypothetical protein